MEENSGEIWRRRVKRREDVRAFRLLLLKSWQRIRSHSREDWLTLKHQQTPPSGQVLAGKRRAWRTISTIVFTWYLRESCFVRALISELPGKIIIHANHFILCQPIIDHLMHRPFFGWFMLWEKLSRRWYTVKTDLDSRCYGLIKETCQGYHLIRFYKCYVDRKFRPLIMC